MKLALLKLVHFSVLHMMSVIGVYAVVSQPDQFHMLNTCKSDLSHELQRPVRFIQGLYQQKVRSSEI